MNFKSADETLKTTMESAIITGQDIKDSFDSKIGVFEFCCNAFKTSWQLIVGNGNIAPALERDDTLNQAALEEEKRVLLQDEQIKIASSRSKQHEDQKKREEKQGRILESSQQMHKIARGLTGDQQATIASKKDDDAIKRSTILICGIGAILDLILAFGLVSSGLGPEIAFTLGIFFAFGLGFLGPQWGSKTKVLRSEKERKEAYDARRLPAAEFLKVSDSVKDVARLYCLLFWSLIIAIFSIRCFFMIKNLSNQEYLLIDIAGLVVTGLIAIAGILGYVHALDKGSPYEERYRKQWLENFETRIKTIDELKNLTLTIYDPTKNLDGFRKRWSQKLETARQQKAATEQLIFEINELQKKFYSTFEVTLNTLLKMKIFPGMLPRIDSCKFEVPNIVVQDVPEIMIPSLQELQQELLN